MRQRPPPLNRALTRRNSVPIRRVSPNNTPPFSSVVVSVINPADGHVRGAECAAVFAARDNGDHPRRIHPFCTSGTLDGRLSKICHCPRVNDFRAIDFNAIARSIAPLSSSAPILASHRILYIYI